MPNVAKKLHSEIQKFMAIIKKENLCYIYSFNKYQLNVVWGPDTALNERKIAVCLAIKEHCLIRDICEGSIRICYVLISEKKMVL